MQASIGSFGQLQLPVAVFHHQKRVERALQLGALLGEQGLAAGEREIRGEQQRAVPVQRLDFEQRFDFAAQRGRLPSSTRRFRRISFERGDHDDLLLAGGRQEIRRRPCRPKSSLSRSVPPAARPRPPASRRARAALTVRTGSPHAAAPGLASSRPTTPNRCSPKSCRPFRQPDEKSHSLSTTSVRSVAQFSHSGSETSLPRAARPERLPRQPGTPKSNGSPSVGDCQIVGADALNGFGRSFGGGGGLSRGYGVERITVGEFAADSPPAARVGGRPELGSLVDRFDRRHGTGRPAARRRPRLASRASIEPPDFYPAERRRCRSAWTSGAG